MGLLDDLRSGTAEDAAGGDFAPSWRWEQPGDGVEGIVITVTSRVHDNHPDGYPIVTIRQPNGEDIAVHCMATVLKNEVNEKRPRAGDEFAVVFDGQKTSPSSGRKYNAFRVAHRAGAGQIPPAAPKSEQEQAAGAGWARKDNTPNDAWSTKSEVPF